jgi:selenocysteine-specific elongation factor
VITRRAIVGTAGHVDHGKTTLVKALTGVDCDRLAEEKARGITIDLGFAWLVDGEVQLGFVDVPGHERFVHNALAGFGGIGMALLVVAADEGIRAQTREHLAILSLLGVRRGVVVITRADLVTDDVIELRRLEIAELLAPTLLADAPMVAVASLEGRGIPELRAVLLELARATAQDRSARPARLPLDRAFVAAGRGAVVTGTLIGGTIDPGDELELVPGREPVRVRAVQVHGEARERVVAGERVAVLLGGIELDQLRRGLTLAAPGSLAEARSLVGEVTWLASAPIPLAGWREVLLHLGTAETPARIRALDPETIAPGTTGLAEIRTAAPIAAARGDLLVVRRPSPAETLGGGTLLDPDWRPRRAGARAKALAALRRDDEAVVLWVEEAGHRGALAERLARRLGLAPVEAARWLESLVGEGRLLRLPVSPPRYVTLGAWKKLAARATKVLAAYFEEHRLADHMPRAELTQRLLGDDHSLAGPLLTALSRQGLVQLEGDRARLPGRRADTTRDEDRLIFKVQRAIEAGGLTAPSPQDLANRLSAKPAILEGILKLLVERRIVVRLPGGLLTSGKAVAELVASLRESGWTVFSIPDFKERFGLSRKWAVPLLEHLDKIGVTRRVGDQRELLPARSSSTPRGASFP